MESSCKITTINNRKITIKDIANELDVSVSAVSFAFSGTGTISEKTRKRILDYCNEVGFIPSIQAQTVKKKEICFAYILSANPESVKNKFVEGLKKACAESGSTHLECDIYEYKTIHKHLEDALRQCAKQAYDGIMLDIDIALESRYADIIEEINKKGIPIVRISSKNTLLQADYIVLTNAKKAGALAADILHLQGCKYAILMRGSAGSALHRRYMMGFKAELERLNMKHISTWLTGDVRSAVKREAKKISETIPPDTGIFLSNCYSWDAADIFKEYNINPPFVCLDLFDETKELLESGRLSAAICQHQTQQGYIAAQKLIEMILTGKRPLSPQVIMTDPEIVTRGALLDNEY